MSGQYIAQRLLWAAFVLLGSSVVIFLLMHLIPGDPAQAMLGPEATPEAVARLRLQLGLDEPLWYQFWIWITSTLKGDLGRSILLSKDVLDLLLERLPVTLLLSLYALAFAVAVAIPLAVLAASRRRTLFDYGGRFLGLIGLAMPSFWLGIMLMLVFSVSLGWFPVFGYVSPRDGLGAHLLHLTLPAVALGSAYAAMIMETTRNGLIEVLRQDFIRTARAGGVPERKVLLKYALRNALIPTVTVIGIQIGYLMSGAIVVESVFAIPGMGRLFVNAVLARDYPLVQGVMLVTVAIFSVANLAVDLLYGLIDPRVAQA